ncbi:site-specific recombinase, DNA invertase Pin [Mesorhizobium loti]|nr:site-specific recombinase, DNA invertase Pin [Mesorhizobium loti]
MLAGGGGAPARTTTTGVAGRLREAQRRRPRGAMRGRPADTERNDAIIAMLRKGQSWNTILKATNCSRSTLAKLAKRPE